jgi:hypothetical protein
LRVAHQWTAAIATTAAGAAAGAAPGAAV